MTDINEYTPHVYEQALERARDDLERQDLLNMVFDLPVVCELITDGFDDCSRLDAVTVGFDTEHGRRTAQIAVIFRRAGWIFHDATFSRDQLTFVKPGTSKFKNGGVPS